MHFISRSLIVSLIIPVELVKIIQNKINTSKAKKDSLALKLVKWQLSLKPELNIKIKFSLEKYIQENLYMNGLKILNQIMKKMIFLKFILTILDLNLSRELIQERKI